MARYTDGKFYAAVVAKVQEDMVKVRFEGYNAVNRDRIGLNDLLLDWQAPPGLSPHQDSQDLLDPLAHDSQICGRVGSSGSI